MYFENGKMRGWLLRSVLAATVVRYVSKELFCTWKLFWVVHGAWSTITCVSGTIPPCLGFFHSDNSLRKRPGRVKDSFSQPTTTPHCFCPTSKAIRSTSTRHAFITSRAEVQRSCQVRQGQLPGAALDLQQGGRSRIPHRAFLPPAQEQQATGERHLVTGEGTSNRPRCCFADGDMSSCGMLAWRQWVRDCSLRICRLKL